MSQLTDDDASACDVRSALSLFSPEPGPVELLEPVVKIPEEIAPADPPLELAVLRERAEAAERSLRELKRELAAINRQMATFVSPAKNNQQAMAARRRTMAAGVALVLVIAGMGGWRRLNAPATKIIAAPAVVEAVEPAPVPETPPPFTTVAVASPLPPVPPRDTPPREVPPRVVPPREVPPRVVPARVVPARDIPARSQERLEAPPRTQYVGTLAVDAVPAGGEVFINRKSVGKTPARITGLRAGSHLVWIEREGYRLFTRVVAVPADKVTRVSVALEPENPAPVRP